MLKFELAETDKHSIKILLRRKNLRFLRRTNLIKTRCKTLLMKTELLELMKNYPSIAVSVIAIISGITGWFFNNFLQLILDKRKHKREIKTFFWKEKLNASKKASEFYLEQLNFLNLLRHQFEIFQIGKIEHQELFENIQKEVSFYSKKLKEFPHYEHHHINVFYDFNEKRSMEINKNTTEIVICNIPICKTILK